MVFLTLNPALFILTKKCDNQQLNFLLTCYILGDITKLYTPSLFTPTTPEMGIIIIPCYMRG